MHRDVLTRRTVTASVALVALVALGGLLTGCSGQDAGSDPSASASSTPTSSATPTPTPTSESPSATSTASPTASETATATPSPTRAPGLADRLLPAADVPGLRTGARWALGTTGPESPSSSFGTCQRFSTLSIGAERALVRRYRPVGGSSDPATADRAGELVAQLPDALTARRAYAVLEAWRGRCADRLTRYRRHTVGTLQDVAVPGGTAGWYLLSYGPVPCTQRCPATLTYADAQGMVVVGNRLAMVSLRRVGSPAGVRKAMPTALQAAARLLR